MQTLTCKYIRQSYCAKNGHKMFVFESIKPILCQYVDRDVITIIEDYIKPDAIPSSFIYGIVPPYKPFQKLVEEDNLFVVEIIQQDPVPQTEIGDFPRNVKEIYFKSDFGSRQTHIWYLVGQLTNGKYFYFNMSEFCAYSAERMEINSNLYCANKLENLINCSLPEHLRRYFML